MGQAGSLDPASFFVLDREVHYPGSSSSIPANELLGRGVLHLHECPSVVVFIIDEVDVLATMPVWLQGVSPRNTRLHPTTGAIDERPRLSGMTLGRDGKSPEPGRSTCCSATGLEIPACRPIDVNS